MVGQMSSVTDREKWFISRGGAISDLCLGLQFIETKQYL